MPFIRDVCPLCGGRLALVHVECQDCHTKFEGSTVVLAAPLTGASSNESARYGALARLSPEQLSFVETFIRARGIIKTVEAMLGISYPTVRNRLDDVIVTMGLSPADESPSGEARRGQREIAADLAEGRITMEEAHLLLHKLAHGESDPE
jgi:hypothetical protein